MDYFDIASRTNYKDQHKLKPSSFAKIEEGTSQRVKTQAIDRKSRRFETFDSNRIIEDDGALSSGCPMISKSEQRLQQLKKWKEEKAVKQQKALQNKIKPFTVGVVRHDLVLYKPVSPLKTSKNIKKPNLRSTRSTLKMLSTISTIKRNTVTNKTDQKQPSFAPSNAKFKVPKNITSDSYTFGSKVGVVTRSKDMFTDPKPSTSGIQSKRSQPEMSSLMVKRTKPVDYVPLGMVGKKEKDTDTLDSFNVFVERLPSTEGPCSSGARKTSTPEMKERPESNQDNKLNTSIKLGESSGQYGTPDNKSSSSSSFLTIVSPFVTVARGKGNLTRENLTKLKLGYVSENTPDKDAAIRFRLVLDSEINRLKDLCGQWSKYKEDNDAALPESAKDHIFQVIGQTNLLISKKFEQFRTLIDRCESQQFVEGGGAVVAQDLEGFWDMVFMQVEDIDLRFKRLTKERDNGWVDENDESKIMKSKSVNLSKKKVLKRNVAPSKGLRALIQASRMKNSKVSSGTEPPQLKLTLSKSNTKIFEAGFFSVTSPMKTTIDKPDRGVKELSLSPSRPPSFLKGVLSSEARKRLSLRKSTPSSVAMMRVSQTAKWAMSTDSQLTQDSMPLASINLNATPAKSILKSRSKRPQRTKASRNKSIKTVLFTESDDDLNATKTLAVNATFDLNSIPMIEVNSHEDTAPAEDSNQRNRYRNYSTTQNKENPESSNLRRATREERNTPVDETVDTMQPLERDSAKKNPNKRGTTKNNISPLARNDNILPEISDLSLNTPRSSKKQKTRSLRSSMVGSEHPICDKSPNTPLRRSARLSKN